MVYRQIDKKCKTILDVGCGRGDFAVTFRRHDAASWLIGVELYVPNLRYLKTRGLYDDLIAADARYLPLRDCSFDAVLAIEVIEHLSKPEGFNLIQSMLDIAQYEVIVSTPVGFMEVYHRELSLSSLSEGEAELLDHKSGWVPSEFRKQGFIVRGQYGPRFLPRDFAYALSFILPLSYLAPNLGWSMVCLRKKSPIRMIDVN